MKQKNGVISTLFFFIIIFSCNLKRTENNKVIQPSKEKTGISIDSVYSLLTTGREINFKELKGSFAYIKADTAIDEHVAGFISDSIHESVLYNSFGGTKNDEIVFKDRKFLVRNRLAPLSIKLYSGSKNEKKWLVFVGQGQSASGTGVQMSFFNLLEMDHNNNVSNHYEFESRFGSIKSIFEDSINNTLDYFKIVHGKDDDLFKLTVNNVKNDKQLVQREMILRYLLNDRFVITEPFGANLDFYK